jgi:hypothetical protein
MKAALQNYQARMRRVLDYIDRHLDSDMDLETVSDVAAFSKFSLHSHSIILSHGNALIFQRKLFLYAIKNRLPGPSEICALDFKHEFGRS